MSTSLKWSPYIECVALFYIDGPNDYSDSGIIYLASLRILTNSPASFFSFSVKKV